MSLMYCCDDMEYALKASFVEFRDSYKLNSFYPDLIYCPWCGARLEETKLVKRAKHLCRVAEHEFFGVAHATTLPGEGKIVVHVKVPGEEDAFDLLFPIVGPTRDAPDTQ